MTGSKIGVVMAAYNAEHLIDQALASLATQTRMPDEVVVVDDCSTDGTADAAARWAAHLPLLVKRTATNSGGPGPGRNLGIEHLSSDIVASLDADDALLPDHLAVLERRMKPGKHAVSPSGWFWSPGEPLVDFFESTRLTLHPTDQLAQEVVCNRVLVSTMYKRVDFLEVGCYRNVFNEDWDLWTRLMAAGVTFDVEPIRTFLYRRHPGTMTSDPAVVARNDAEAFERAVAVALPVLGAETIERCRVERARLVAGNEVRRLSDAGDDAGARAAARAVGQRDPSLWLTAHLPPSASRLLRSAKRRARR
jgi:glycosyltransferase involved in cell wall biosynthesis